MGAGQASDLADLTRFVGVSAQDRDLLRQIHPTLAAALPAALDLLYADMRKHGAAIGRFADEAHLERARVAQLEHWRRLLLADFDEAYVQRAKRTGAVHARIGLSHGVYIGGYALVLGALMRALSAAGTMREDDGGAIVATLLKCALLDISVVQSAYLEATEAESVARSRFVTSLGDELRTPLNIIIGYAELLLEDVSGQLSTSSELHQVIESSERLRRLVDGLLDLARVQSAGDDLHLERLVPGEAAFSAIELVRDDASARNVALGLTVEPGADAPISTDPDKLGRCLHILLRNAVRFAAGGVVDLRVSRIPGLGGDAIAFEVRDTGVGMSDAQLARVFEGAASGVRDRGGPGFGLMIVRTLAKHLNGELTAKSKLGEGSVFTLRLQCTEDGGG